MREAGAVPLGKTTVPEFGAASVTHSALCGTTRNPWNLAKTPGGSSGGAAASVIAGMGTIALGSDAAGSIRLPASMSGTFGLKTTFGRVPDYPSSYLGPLAVVGPMTRTVEDASLCMDVITRHDVRDSYCLAPEEPAAQARSAGDGLAGLRILYSPTLGFAKVDPELAGIVRKGVERLATLGAKVEEIDFVMEDPSAILWTIMAARMAHAFEVFNFSSADMAMMNPRLVASVERGRSMGLLPYLEACRQQELFGARMRKLYERFDLIVTPSVAVPSGDLESDEISEPRYAAITDRSPFVRPFNLSKQPAASLPVGVTADGMPVGMQVVGPLYGDRTVLRACAAYEAAFPFAAPDLSAIARAKPPKAVPQGIQSMLDAISKKDQ
jgi:aspartyl-tRNA(Asn)/glutamyl-tRNA(Gln) amidotransferase subunit A